MVQKVKDLALSLQWLGSLLWHLFDPWPWNFYRLWALPKLKKERSSRIQASYLPAQLLDLPGSPPLPRVLSFPPPWLPPAAAASTP